MKKELERLKQIDKELYLLKGMASMLYWDRATLMPKKGLNFRAEKLAMLNKQMHEKATSNELKKVIKTLSKPNNYKKLSKIDKLVVDKHQKKIKKLSKIPSIHVEKFSKIVMKSAAAWEEAKEKKKFSIFKPYLEKVLALKVKEAKLINPKIHPYNVFLDDFEEGMKYEDIKIIFGALKEGLIEILNNIKKTKKYKQQKDLLKKMDFPEKSQEVIVKDLTKLMGMEADRSIISTSVHPFTLTVAADDVRITTAYREGQPMFSFTSTAHEAGHALYELDFDPKLRYTILADAPSYGLHESQSRIWENQVCRSLDFWKFYYPFYKKQFKCLKNTDMRNFYELINQVRPSFIRIEGDEITYCLHIIIRFELELDLVEGKLKVKDLPKAWNKKYKEYMGITPRNDAEGALQDMHWSEGYFGYFPTYALGTLYSAMLFTQMEKEGITKNIRKGNLAPIHDWLHKKVHRYGSTMLTKDIIKRATGRLITPEDFLSYLKEKYYDIYGVK